MLQLVIGLVFGVLGSVGIWGISRGKMGGAGEVSPGVNVEQQYEQRAAMIAEARELFETLVPKADLGIVQEEIDSIEKDIATEKGRVNITYAELESLESRLRELHEIDQELEASNQESQEELKALEARQNELRERNDTLKSELDVSMQKIEDLSSELEISVQMQEQINGGKLELEKSQNIIDNLLLSISEASQVYISMKKRYDALDIEFAQLYDRVVED